MQNMRQSIRKLFSANKFAPILQVFLLMVVLALLGLLRKMFERFGEFLDKIPFLPTSIFTLDMNWIYAFFFTASASIFVYLMARVIGYVAGRIVGIAHLSDTFIGIKTPLISVPISVLYQFIYIIPFAITISVAYSVAFIFQLDLISTGLFLLFVAATALPGYKVFKSIYSAVSNPKDDNRYLCRSLYVPCETSLLSRLIPLALLEKWILARRLSDCEYHSFNESVIDAFHLSVISVVIIEMVVPNFYEHFLPGTYQPYYGGIGRMIINAQQSLTWEQIFGILWLLLIFDWSITQVITWMNYSRRDHHYQSRAEV